MPENPRCSTPSPGVFPVDDGIDSLDGQDITFLPEHRRAPQVARVFQNPLDGTAASMTVEENLAMAAARGRRRRLRRGVRASEREQAMAALAQLGSGLEAPAAAARGPAVRGTAASPQPAHGHH